jgi:hypothetical protein
VTTGCRTGVLAVFVVRRVAAVMVMAPGLGGGAESQGRCRDKERDDGDLGHEKSPLFCPGATIETQHLAQDMAVAFQLEIFDDLFAAGPQ